jgi:asparagine synthetase B (glutamine-hydrolysing)
MNSFILNIKLPFISDSLTITEIPLQAAGNSSILIRTRENKLRFNYEDDRVSAIFFGDLIIPPAEDMGVYLKKLFRSFSPESIRSLKGHFYLVITEKRENKLSVYNSMFSLLPLYYYIKTENEIVVSTSAENLKNFINNDVTLNRKFIAERILFNFSFRDDTLYNEIKLLPSNSFISAGKNFSIHKHTNIEDNYLKDPAEWEKNPDTASDIFINNCRCYFPDEFFYVTLTGGLDGRTITAAASADKKIFETFSYGMTGYKDISIPEQISGITGIPHRTFFLDEKYSQENFISMAEKLISLTDASASFTRSHYAYTAAELAKKSGFLLSGNFGSELIRTMRIPGVMTSPLLLKIFSTDDEDLIRKELYSSVELEMLNKTYFKEELESVFEEIICYKKKLPDSLNANQKFYIYMFEEVFRKYFGPEIIIQNYFGISNRTPFLDYEFFSGLLKTNYAGVNARYLEKNPFLRFKGQVLYSQILKKLDSSLINHPTDKGYAPADLLTITGKLNITGQYLKKKLIQEKDEGLSYNQIFFEKHKEYFRNLEFPGELFNKKIIKGLESKLTDPLAHIYSLIIYLNKFVL